MWSYLLIPSDPTVNQSPSLIVSHSRFRDHMPSLSSNNTTDDNDNDDNNDDDDNDNNNNTAS